MKKRIWKITVLVVALILTIGIIWLGVALMGNPLSKYLSKRSAQQHLDTFYPNTDFVVTDISYSFKTGGYYAHVKSPSSLDSEFTLGFDHWRKFRWDSYEDRVVHKENTALRINRDYAQLVDKVLSQLSIYDPDGIQYGILELNHREALKNEDVLLYTMALEDLELDRVYDVGALGAQCGTLVLYINTKDTTPEYAARVMLELRQSMDQARVGFRGIHLTLTKPLPKGELRRRDRDFSVEAFPYKEIYEKGLAERILEAHMQLEQKTTEMDGVKASK